MNQLLSDKEKKQLNAQNYAQLNDEIGLQIYAKILKMCIPEKKRNQLKIL